MSYNTDMTLQVDPSHAGEQGEPASVAARSLATDKWYVLHTKSRQEKTVAEQLVARRVRHFLPLVERVHFYGKRKAVVSLPLFPSYVFLHGTAEQAYEVDRTRRLVRIIAVDDQQQIEWELQNLRMALEEKAPLDPYPYLKKGIRAEVKSGPLAGLQGVVEDRPRPDRLILQIDMLGRALSLEIEGALLEPLV